MEYVFAILGVLIGVAIGYLVRKKLAEAKINTAEDEAKRILLDAKKDAEAKKKEALVEAKDEIYKLRVVSEKENKERRNEVTRMERRILQ